MSDRSQIQAVAGLDRSWHVSASRCIGLLGTSALVIGAAVVLLGASAVTTIAVGACAVSAYASWDLWRRPVGPECEEQIASAEIADAAQIRSRVSTITRTVTRTVVLLVPLDLAIIVLGSMIIDVSFVAAVVIASNKIARTATRTFWIRRWERLTNQGLFEAPDRVIQPPTRRYIAPLRA